MTHNNKLWTSKQAGAYKMTEHGKIIANGLPIDALFYIAYDKEEIPDIDAAREYAATVLEILGVDIDKLRKIL